MNILAITSHVVFGHVGGQAAVPALQRLGHEVWHLPTVLFSNHPGHGGFAGEAVAPALSRKLIDGLDARGLLARVDGLLSGYLGTAETAEIVARTVARIRRERPLVYCCDPVLGDGGRRYVADGILEAMRERLLPLADILTPNRDELAWLAERPIGSLEDAIAAAKDLRRLGAGSVVCTSAALNEGRLGTIVLGDGGAFAVETAALDGAPHGAGDLFAALFLAARLDGLGDGDALARAGAQTDAVIRETLRAGDDELAVVAAASALSLPQGLPAARRLD